MLLGLLFSALLVDAEFYHARYALPDTQTKLVNNHGNGFEELYGVRNFREVLKGVLYRGGANNHWHRTNKRANNNPLPEDGLLNLCEEGFKTSIYLYTTNFATASPVMGCQSLRGPNELKYVQLSSFSKQREILEIVHAAIVNPENGPVYAHCWNGWHASGMVSAFALKQFCGMSGKDAVAYWEANVDGHDSPDYAKLKRQMRDFQPYANLQIDAATQARICP